MVQSKSHNFATQIPFHSQNFLFYSSSSQELNLSLSLSLSNLQIIATNQS